MELAEELGLVEALRAGDETAFMTLVDRYGPSMLRLAMVYVRNRSVAEEVVQEAWLGVLRGIGSFEGRSSLRTWIFRILTNTAKTRGERERRTVPEARLLSRETLAVVEEAIAALPPAQRAVITLRDVEGFGSEEVCNVLELT